MYWVSNLARSVKKEAIPSVPESCFQMPMRSSGLGVKGVVTPFWQPLKRVANAHNAVTVRCFNNRGMTVSNFGPPGRR